MSGRNAVGVGQLAVGLDRERAVRAVERAGRAGSTLPRLIAVATSSMPMLARGELARIDVDAHGVLLRAEDRDLRDALRPSRCAARSLISAYSLTSESGSVGELSVRKRIGESAGFTFWNDGGAGMSGGSDRVVREIATCTSCAAASMSRSRSNCSVMFVLPWRVASS